MKTLEQTATEVVDEFDYILDSQPAYGDYGDDYDMAMKFWYKLVEAFRRRLRNLVEAGSE